MTITKLHHRMLDGRVKWNEIYDSEEELVAELLKSGDYQKRDTKGYVYLESFKARVMSGTPLTEKQMVQLKRLAVEVFRNVHERPWGMI